MRRGLTGLTLIPTDLVTSIEVTSGAGYDVLEFWAPRVAAFLDEGHTVEEIAAKLKTVSSQPHSIVSIEEIDVPEGAKRKELIAFCRRMCQVAQAIGCPNIQMESGPAFEGSPWPTIRKEAARGLQDMADITAEYGLTVAFEPLAWMPLKSLEQALEVIDEAGRPNVGILVDTFMVYAGGGKLDTIRNLDPKTISTVHLGDTAPKEGEVWSDDSRYTMAGDGIVPIRDIMMAILDTGYDGVLTDEMSSKRYSSWDRARIAKEVKAKGDAILSSL